MRASRSLRAARLWRRRGSVRRSHTRSPPCPPSLSHSRSRSCSSKCSCPCSHSWRPVNKKGALPRSPHNRGRDLSSRTGSRLAARPPPWWSPCFSPVWVIGTRQRRQAAASAVHEQALLALDRDDKPRPTPESSRGSTLEAAEQRVERPSVSSDLGSDCEEILAGRPFYLLLLTGRQECEHGHWRARARVGREAGVCVSDARCQCLPPSGAGGGYYLRQLPGALFGSVLGE